MCLAVAMDKVLLKDQVIIIHRRRIPTENAIIVGIKWHSMKALHFGAKIVAPTL